MKRFVFFVVLFCLFSCKTKQTIVIGKSDCPLNYKCTNQNFQNKKVTLTLDTTNTWYSRISKGNNIVFEYKLKKNTRKGIADGHYSETVLLEFSINTKKLFLKNEELSQTNALFERSCFCRGEAGGYKIQKGILSIEKITKKSYRIQFDFTIEKGRQLVKHIDEIIVLD